MNVHDTKVIFISLKIHSMLSEAHKFIHNTRNIIMKLLYKFDPERNKFYR